MPQVTDMRQKSLHRDLSAASTGLYSTQDAQKKWLKDIRGRTGNTLQELWTQEFLATGGANVKIGQSYMDNQKAWLKNLSHTQPNSNDEWFDYWFGEAFPNNLVQNPNFATALNWTFGIGWSHDAVNGWAHCDGTQTGTSVLGQTNVTTIGKTYLCRFLLSNVTFGGVNFVLGNSTSQTGFLFASGFYEYTLTAVGSTSVNFHANSGFIGNVEFCGVWEV